MLLTSCKLLQRKLLDVGSDFRGSLRNFGLNVDVVSSFRYEARVCGARRRISEAGRDCRAVLSVRRVIRQQLAVLHKMLLATVLGDPMCRRLMTVPGVGADSHRISHPNSGYGVGLAGMKHREDGHEVPDFPNYTDRHGTCRDRWQRITKPLHCHCANPANVRFFNLLA
jgi:hypothetical protein